MFVVAATDDDDGDAAMTAMINGDDQEIRRELDLIK